MLSPSVPLVLFVPYLNSIPTKPRESIFRDRRELLFYGTSGPNGTIWS